MKLKYLGTAAAEGIPGIFCNCPVCKQTRALGGKNYRSRAQALINDDLLLDFGPDSYWHACRFDVDLTKIRTLLVTHAHEDHYTPAELAYRENGFGYLNGDFNDDDSDYPHLNVYLSGNSFAYAPVHFYETHIQKNAPVDFHTVAAFVPFTAGQYTITPLAANHAPGFEALIYSISDGKSTLLYAHDTGIFPAETMDYLQATRPVFDFISLDCTGMVGSCGSHHMNIRANAVMKQKLTAIGCAHEKTVWCCNHFSHNGRRTYDTFVPVAAEHGFVVSYDGMEAEF